MKELINQDQVELISDDFQSTFTLSKTNTLVNMLQGEHEFPIVEMIIKKHCGPVKVQFIKTNDLGLDEYDIYVMEISE